MNAPFVRPPAVSPLGSPPQASPPVAEPFQPEPHESGQPISATNDDTPGGLRIGSRRQSRKSARWPFVGLVVLGLALVAGYAKWSDRPDPLANVLIGTVERGDIEQSVLATGTIRPEHLVAVGAQVSGRLTRMHVAVGDDVHQGDLIAEIDDSNQRNAVNMAEAQLDSVHAQLREKEAILARTQAALSREEITLAQKATSRDSYENAQMQVRQTLAQIEFLKAQTVIAEVGLATARVNLGYTRILAPSDGKVLLIVTQQGQTVNAMQSAPTIVVIGSVARMAVKADISEADISRVRPGLPVYFTVLGNARDRWEARLASIDPAPDSVRNDALLTGASGNATVSASSTQASASAIYYCGRFDVDNANGKLLTYMTAQIHIVLDRANGVLTVPVEAVSPADSAGRRFVEVVGPDGRLERRRVETGLDDQVRIEIRSGLSVGERIVAGRKSAEAVPAMFRMPPPPPPPGM